MFGFGSEIKKLKREDYDAPRVENNPVFRIKIIGRGEQLFYHDKELGLALMIDISLMDDCVFASSIERWDNKAEVSDEEKAIVVKRVKQYFLDHQGTEVNVR
jgi:hypothetical protein